jgi:tetratricopeptide (TPR) repeat protein
MKALPLLIATLGLVGSGVLPARATDNDVNRCTDRVVEACTNLIKDGRLAGRELSAALIKRSIALLENREIDAAIRDLTTAIKLDPLSVDARLQLALAYGRSTQPSLALGIYREGLALAPNDYRLYNNRGVFLESQGQAEAAIADLSRAIELNAKDHILFTTRARMLLAQGKPDEAIADLDRVFKLTIINPEASTLRGEARLLKKDYQGALDDFSRAIQYEPSRWQAYQERARVLIILGDREKALPDLDKALGLNPRAADALTMRCVVRGTLGRDLRAGLADCDAAIGAGGATAGRMSNRGMIRLLLGMNEGAVWDFSVALAKNKDDPQALQGRGIALRRLGRQEEADRDFAASERLSPGITQRYARYDVPRVPEGSK